MRINPHFYLQEAVSDGRYEFAEELETMNCVMDRLAAAEADLCSVGSRRGLLTESKCSAAVSRPRQPGTTAKDLGLALLAP